MESRELKSKSEDTKTNEEKGEFIPKVSVEPLAQQHQAIVSISQDELRVVFNKYWELHFQSLINKFNVKLEKKKKGKVDLNAAQKILEKTIGLDKLYKDVIYTVFIEKMDEFNGKKDSLLFITSVKLSGFNTESDEAVIVGMFYYRPLLELTEDLDFSLKRAPRRDWDELWAAELKRITYKNKILTPCEDDDTAIEAGMEVLIDIHASCKGEPEPELSCRLRWFDIDGLQIESFKEGLLGHKKGDLFEMQYLMEDEETSKEVIAQVKIHEMSRITLPEMGDALIKKEFSDFDTLSECEAHNKNLYLERMKVNDRNFAAEHILNQIISKVEVPLVPMAWIENTATRAMQDHIKQCGSAEKAMKAIGVSSESAMLSMFCDESHGSYVRDLASRKYAHTYDLDVQDTETLLDDMYDRIQWEGQEV